MEILDFLEKSQIGIPENEYRLVKDRIRFNFKHYKKSAVSQDKDKEVKSVSLPNLGDPWIPEYYYLLWQGFLSLQWRRLFNLSFYPCIPWYYYTLFLKHYSVFSILSLMFYILFSDFQILHFLCIDPERIFKKIYFLHFFSLKCEVNSLKPTRMSLMVSLY